ncbi:MAG: cell division ATP-binding protein FtsE [Thermodesulfobacteriota bacterium]
MQRETATGKPLVELINVTKVYPPDVVALEDISLRVDKGDILFLTGKSGAGKTTLLKLLCCIESPSSGEIIMAGCDLAKLKPAGVQRMRQKIGVAYQEFKLLHRQTVFQNIAMAMEVAYASPKAIRERVSELLELLGLADKRDKLAAELSRGEQQRVALARAAANHPPLLLADEPSGNLDPAATELVLSLIHRLNREHHTTVIIATHDEALYAHTPHRVVNLCHGRISAGGSRMDEPVWEEAEEEEWSPSLASPARSRSCSF